MARTLDQIIETLEQKGFDERLKHVEASWRFDIDGKGSYRLEVDEGAISFRRDSGPADCMIACGADDFVRLANGEANLLTAAMQGRVRVEGNLALAKLLHGFLPGSRQERQQEGAPA